jgi:SARP family transcriptional regulator, regulator of embCAB operon
MRYELLGPLRVIDADGTRSLTSQKIEILLAALLIQANQVLTVDQLVAEIWPGNPPQRAISTLQVYISQLRKFLSGPRRSNNSIYTHPCGYRLCVEFESDQVDSHIFTNLMSAGRRDARNQHYETASAAFESALLLYRGQAVGGTAGGTILGQFSAWLEETRLDCIESLIESKLKLGYHRDVTGRLYSLIVEYPFREAFYRQLMLALYRSERQYDALRVYNSARVTLHSELGVEPGRQLRELQRAILIGDRSLDSQSLLPALPRSFVPDHSEPAPRPSRRVISRQRKRYS